jgi:glyoxylase-like metal-dependent hydrolase (beta-lactamase superfamily II)
MLLIPAGNASAWTGPTGNNTYLIPGAVPTLIDAGVGNADHLDAISRALDGRDLAVVLLTHGHVDHASGVPRVRERWPGVVVRSLDSGDAPLAAGERITAGDRTLVAIATPGHSPDHCCFLDEPSCDLFCGDLARAGGTIVIPASRGGDLAAYLRSLAHVRALRPARLLPGHGPIVDEPEALIDEYVRHRASRDAEILRVLEDGQASVEQIAAEIYRGLPQPLVPAARETVLAHLIKLQGEGRVGTRGEVWVRQAG